MYENLCNAQSDGRLPQLKKGIVLHTLLNKEPNPDPLALFHHKVIINDVLRKEIVDLPLLLVGWTSGNIENDTSYTPCGLSEDCRWQYSASYSLNECFWTQFSVSKERREQHPKEFMHYHPATYPSGSFIVSVATYIDYVLQIINEPSWHSRLTQYAPPGDVSFSPKYYASLFTNERIRANAGPVLDFAEAHVYGCLDPVSPRVVANEEVA